MKVTAILLDATGIQQYVFGSNVLKENLSASYLVENIFEDILRNSLDKIQIKNVELNEWKEKPQSIFKPEIEMEIGYIGGGNALLFFKERSKAINFVKEWTKKLLVESPGLTTSVALENFDMDNFSEELKRLFNKLFCNKFTFQQQVILPSHGITAECSRTGLSAERIIRYDNRHIPISSVATSKIEVKDEANKKLYKKFQKILDNNKFPELIDELGQRKGESNYISIVHVDGNGIGERFKECKKLEDIRRLSVSVDKAIENSMAKLLENIISKYNIFQKNFNLKNNILPLRPIIFGGDDVTFIADGRLGVYFAEIFIKEFIKQPVSDGKLLSACAGIAITKSKYPFYRGYELAEQLCHEAKKKANEEKDSSSWLDFHIAYGGFSGSIQEIRDRNYTVPDGQLCLRPYRVAGANNDYKNLSECIKGIRNLNRLPRSKLIELRNILTQGETAAKQFIKELKFRGFELPDIKGYPSFKDDGWANQETPYFDMIELMEFYPMDLLTVEVKND